MVNVCRRTFFYSSRTRNPLAGNLRQRKTVQLKRNKAYDQFECLTHGCRSYKIVAIRETDTNIKTVYKSTNFQALTQITNMPDSNYIFSIMSMYTQKYLCTTLVHKGNFGVNSASTSPLFGYGK